MNNNPTKRVQKPKPKPMHETCDEYFLRNQLKFIKKKKRNVGVKECIQKEKEEFKR